MASGSSSSIPGPSGSNVGFSKCSQADNSFKGVAQLQYTMASSKFGRKLNPYRSLREPLGVKGMRQSLVITNNPSSIDQNQQLLVRFPNLGAHDVIVPGTARLAFTITPDSEDVNRTVAQNLGRAIVKKLTIKISGNEVMSIDHSDVFHCYNDLWKTALERANGYYQRIDASDHRNIADAFSNRFFTLLDFELLESHMPFDQSALGDRLEHELTVNDYNRVIQAVRDVDASYHIGGRSLEYDMVTLPELARMIDNQYKGRLAIPYDRVLRHQKITMDKFNTLWNINLNVPACSMKGILMLFENVAAHQPFARNTQAFYNPKITKVEIIIEGISNQLYSQWMRAYQMWDEAKKYFAASPGSKRHPEVGTVAKDLAMADVNLGEFLNSKYTLWLDLRTSDDDRLHGSGRRKGNASEGITIQITKKAEAAGALNIYLFVVMVRNLILKMAGSSQRLINLLPQTA